MCSLCFSSETYFIKASNLAKLEKKVIDSKKIAKFNEKVVIFVDANNVYLVNGWNKINEITQNDFVETIVCYYSLPSFIGFFINIIKPLKRKFYVRNSMSFRVRFDKLLEANLTRGERNRENAYQWTNKRWKMSNEEALIKYDELYQSLKENGYDEKYPMIVMINRKFGVKDQILQGHHRIGICKEVGIEEVNICFWTTPMNFKLFKLLCKKKV